MKRIVWVILPVFILFTSCRNYYHVTTEEDFREANACALNCTAENYTLDSISSVYVQDRMYYRNSAVWHIDTYRFTGGYEYVVRYRYGVTDNDLGYFYIKECNLEYCNLDKTTCEEIGEIYSNLPESDMRHLTEGSYLAGMLGIMILPFLALLTYSALYNINR